jgi:membrane-associated phospholipid phosphatase
MRRNRGPHCLFGMLIGIVLAATLTVHAQSNPTPTTSALEKDFFKNILKDQKTLWTAPFHIQQHDKKWIVPGSIGLMALFTTDRITGDEMAEFDRPVKTSRIVSYGGSVFSLGALSATMYVFGREKNNARARETGLLTAEALVDSIIVESALKVATQRARPMDGVERSEFFVGGSSFPSGHSTQAWAVATVIAREYRHRRAIQIAAYGAASAISIARFTSHKHYISDVVAGSALGYGIGNYVYQAHHDKSLDSALWPTITPEINRRAHAYGVGLTWNF